MPVPGFGPPPAAGQLRGVPRRIFTGARDAAASLINRIGGDPRQFGPGADPGGGMHVATSRNIANALGRVLPIDTAAYLTEAIGEANELVPGALQAAIGEPFHGPAGYDFNDIMQNRIGIAQARRELEKRLATHPTRIPRR